MEIDPGLLPACLTSSELSLKTLSVGSSQSVRQPVEFMMLSFALKLCMCIPIPPACLLIFAASEREEYIPSTLSSLSDIKKQDAN